jgi:hypothetical protein
MKKSEKLLFVEIPTKVGSTWRDATTQEIKESEELRKKIDSVRSQIEALEQKEELLTKSCKHIVRYDVSGYEYDGRHCNACDGLLGLI